MVNGFTVWYILHAMGYGRAVTQDKAALGVYSHMHARE